MEPVKLTTTFSVKLDDFLFNVKVLNPKELSITVTDTTKFLIYESQSIKLNAILADTVRAALERKDTKNLSTKIL
jgi:hypothetical protein